MNKRKKSHTKPGILLKNQIPIRTFADWNENCPGFVEIDLVDHELWYCKRRLFTNSLEAPSIASSNKLVLES